MKNKKLYILLSLIIACGLGVLLLQNQKHEVINSSHHDNSHTATSQNAEEVSTAQTTPSNELQHSNQLQNSNEEIKPNLTKAIPQNIKQIVAQDQATLEPAVKAQELFCKKISYNLNDRVPSQIREKIQNFKNIIPLPSDGKRLENTLCIRINGFPIAYKKMKSKKNAILVDSGISDKSKIEVSYCSGKGQCPFQCVIPKDDFLISLGGASDENELDSLGKETMGWKKGQKLSAEEQELHNNAQDIKEIFAIGGEQDSKIFNGWTIKEEADVGCSNHGQKLSRR